MGGGESLGMHGVKRTPAGEVDEAKEAAKAAKAQKLNALCMTVLYVSHLQHCTAGCALTDRSSPRHKQAAQARGAL